MKHKSLAEERPELLAQWAQSNKLSPSDVSCASHKKVWWICVKGHTWEDSVKNRVLLGSGCPYCKHRALLKGENDRLAVNPNLAASWSPKNRIKPSDVFPASNIEVLWVCEKGHEWKARIADRSAGHGCPYCSGNLIQKGINDLATTHPELMIDWSSKNIGLSPEAITHKSRSKVWWHCSKCGNDYQATVVARVKGRSCPFCEAKELRQLRENRKTEAIIAKDFEYLLPQLAVIYYAGTYRLKVHTDYEDLLGIPVIAYVPEICLVIDVCSFTGEIRVKSYLCGIKGIKYVNMPEKLTEIEIIRRVHKAFFDMHVSIDSNPAKDLEYIRLNFRKWRKNKISE